VIDAAQVPFDAWRWLGPQTGADRCGLRANEKALVLFLEPVSLVVAVPPLPGGDAALARFCRALGRAARELAAADLDPARTSPSVHHPPATTAETEDVTARLGQDRG
jgi:hypothetical protein